MMDLGPEALSFVRNFIIREKLPKSYEDMVRSYLMPLTMRIQMMIRKSSRVPVIGINGAQGTGKSTCAACIAGLLQNQGLSVLVLSIDDLYYPKVAREKNAKEIHPLLVTRGVPGTHEMDLFRAVVETARGEATEPLTTVPRFDKAADDRCKEGSPFPDSSVDVILFEGWCVGALPQDPVQLMDPSNALEQEHDADGLWRTYVNNQLSGCYAEAFALIDYLIMLKAPTFEKVYAWRGEQEEKLRERTRVKEVSVSGVMNQKQLAYFISHYERLTRWMLEEMPLRADEVLRIDDEHTIASRKRNNVLPVRYLVSTDLDATLLDDNYRWDAALPALRRLAHEKALLVLNSSKTVSEMTELARELIEKCELLPAPLVAENGGVLAVPNAAGSGYRIEHIGKSRKEILFTAHRLRREEGFVFTGFADMTPEEIMEHTGLTREAAIKAMDRQATEPILWNDSEGRWEAFYKALKYEGIRAVQGGRFIHLMGSTDKADGMMAALTHHQEQDPDSFWQLVALGDSPNDLEMLSAADIAVVINNSSQKTRLKPSALHCLYPEQEGPAAWNEAVLAIMEDNI